MPASSRGGPLKNRYLRTIEPSLERNNGARRGVSRTLRVRPACACERRLVFGGSKVARYLFVAGSLRKIATGTAGRPDIRPGAVTLIPESHDGHWVSYSGDAAEAMTHVLTYEMRGKNITVNAIAPGPRTAESV